MNGDVLCNACGLFYKLHGVIRPVSKDDDSTPHKLRDSRGFHQQKFIQPQPQPQQQGLKQSHTQLKRKKSPLNNQDFLLMNSEQSPTYSSASNNTAKDHNSSSSSVSEFGQFLQKEATSFKSLADDAFMNEYLVEEAINSAIQTGKNNIMGGDYDWLKLGL